MLQRYQGLGRVRGGGKRLQGVTVGYKGYRGLQGITGAYKMLHRVTRV